MMRPINSVVHRRLMSERTESRYRGGVGQAQESFSRSLSLTFMTVLVWLAQWIHTACNLIPVPPSGTLAGRTVGACGCVRPNNANLAAGRHLRFFCGDPGQRTKL